MAAGPHTIRQDQLRWRWRKHFMEGRISKKEIAEAAGLHWKDVYQFLDGVLMVAEKEAKLKRALERLDGELLERVNRPKYIPREMGLNGVRLFIELNEERIKEIGTYAENLWRTLKKQIEHCPRVRWRTLGIQLPYRVESLLQLRQICMAIEFRVRRLIAKTEQYSARDHRRKIAHMNDRLRYQLWIMSLMRKRRLLKNLPSRKPSPSNAPAPSNS